MIKESIQKAINEQIAREFYSSHLYLAMAAYFHNLNLNGFANWMRLQAQEEMTHALKFFDYILQRQGRPEIGMIQQTPLEWNGSVDAFTKAYEHEQYITQTINDLADLAIKEGDHATNALLQWFITEQVEEEASVSEIVDRLTLAGDSPGGLFILDNELKQRKPAPANGQA